MMTNANSRPDAEGNDFHLSLGEANVVSLFVHRHPGAN